MIAEHMSALEHLWQEAFGNPPVFTELFFKLGYSPDRSHCILEEGVPVSALYWFDCQLDGHKLAYLYGVATLKSHRGKGLAQRLMAQTHEILCSRGYSGALLVPEDAGLFRFYEKIGYRSATRVAEFTCQPADTPQPLQQVGVSEYIRLRDKLLPAGSVTLSAPLTDLMAGYCQFYAGEDFLLAGEFTDRHFVAQEFLGNTNAAPGILRALDCEKGHFRTPGAGRSFAMFLPLVKNCPVPVYFAPALD